MIKRNIEVEIEGYEDEDFSDDEDTEEKFVIEAVRTSNIKSPKIGHDCVSETLIPCPYEFYYNNTTITFCDCPGFRDNRSRAKLIAATIGNNLLVKNTEIKKICLVSDYSSFIAERGTPFMQGVVKVIDNMFKKQDYETYDPISSIIFLITKNNSLSRKDILINLREFKEGFQKGYESNKALFGLYIDTLDRIMRYRNYYAVKPLDGGKTRDSILNGLCSNEITLAQKKGKLKIPEFIPKNIFDFIGSESTKSYLKIMTQTLISKVRPSLEIYLKWPKKKDIIEGQIEKFINLININTTKINEILLKQKEEKMEFEQLTKNLYIEEQTKLKNLADEKENLTNDIKKGLKEQITHSLNNLKNLIKRVRDQVSVVEQAKMNKEMSKQRLTKERDIKKEIRETLLKEKKTLEKEVEEAKHKVTNLDLDALFIDRCLIPNWNENRGIRETPYTYIDECYFKKKVEALEYKVGWTDYPVVRIPSKKDWVKYTGTKFGEFHDETYRHGDDDLVYISDIDKDLNKGIVTYSVRVPSLSQLKHKNLMIRWEAYNKKGGVRENRDLKISFEVDYKSKRKKLELLKAKIKEVEKEIKSMELSGKKLNKTLFDTSKDLKRLKELNDDLMKKISEQSELKSKLKNIDSLSKEHIDKIISDISKKNENIKLEMKNRRNTLQKQKKELDKQFFNSINLLNNLIKKNENNLKKAQDQKKEEKIAAIKAKLILEKHKKAMDMLVEINKHIQIKAEYFPEFLELYRQL